MLGLLTNIFPNVAPPSASNFSGMVDRLYDAIHWFSVWSFVIVIGAAVYFVVRYRRRREDEPTPYIEGHTPTEVGVSIGLFVVVMAMFYFGYRDYAAMRTMPNDALEINVIGRQWDWEFHYTNGRIITRVTAEEDPELVIPRGRKVKLLMTSNDVLHSFYVPAFRVKQDVIPKTYTALWFEATQLGTYPVFCAEYCGGRHSKMLAKVRVVETEEFTEWQHAWEVEGVRKAAERASAAPAAAANGTTTAAPAGGQGLAEQGKTLFTAKACNACHTLDGGASVGPTLKGIFGHEVELADGQKATIDENYLRESIMQPSAKVVKGFAPGVMPTYQGQLSDADLLALIEMIKGL